MPSSGGTISRRSAPSRRRGPQRQRTAAAANAEDDTEEVRALRAKYPTQLAMLSELFPSWTDEDLLFVISESSGIVEVAVGRISGATPSSFRRSSPKRHSGKRQQQLLRRRRLRYRRQMHIQILLLVGLDLRLHRRRRR